MMGKKAKIALCSFLILGGAALILAYPMHRIAVGRNCKTPFGWCLEDIKSQREFNSYSYKEILGAEKESDSADEEHRFEVRCFEADGFSDWYCICECRRRNNWSGWFDNAVGCGVWYQEEVDTDCDLIQFVEVEE